MVVVTLTDCPPKLRGDLTKWLLEINTGVYVGKINARVREELWKRICDNIKSGRATMVFSAKNEQGLSFYVHNTSWEPVNYDGIQLIRRPASANEYVGLQTVKKKLNSRVDIRHAAAAQHKKKVLEGYCIVDIETTGLEYQQDEIIEIASIRIINHQIADRFSVLVKSERKISEQISEMTGITNEMLQNEGICPEDAMEQFLEFIGTSPRVSHNIAFDRAFISKTIMKLGKSQLRNICKDTLTLARRRIDDIPDYKLETIARYYNINVIEKHRALADCITTFQIYEKLNEI